MPLIDLRIRFGMTPSRRKERIIVVWCENEKIGFLVDEIRKHGPSDLRFATFLFKPAALRQSFLPDYVGFEVPNDFLVGYGLDYDGHGRNYDAIYKLCQ
ncbi:MAG: chemotaxis protein CheW [Bacteroidota bacterium]